MKATKLLALSLMTLAPALLLASTAADKQIDHDANKSYNFHVVLDDKVTASTENGVVTLTGTVDDKDQSKLAEDTVENLSGVVSVNNNIEVEHPGAERSDSWITLKVKSLLLVRANVSAKNTHVDVTDGVVTLTGTADNDAQKELTESYVKSVDGVRSVKNDLVVANPPIGENNRSVGDAVDDASITTQVKYALLSHKATSAFATKVKTKDGVVTVSGEASSDAERDLVTKLAESVRGVKSVDNEMTVRSS